ncbi:endonuclease/exonuclease/phosphatase family protein [Bacteroides ovatus]|nr:endonuclease/exonuclease/phosphatase family protein [Bacteroides ovatus]
MMKIITYNVNGLRAAVSKGLPEWLAQENPDILCLQETKLQPTNIREKCLKHWATSLICTRRRRRDTVEWLYLPSGNPPCGIWDGNGSIR